MYFPKVTYIKAQAFQYAWGCKDIILGTRANLENTNAFQNHITIYVDDDDLEWYSTATNWKELYDAGKVKAVSELNES